MTKSDDELIARLEQATMRFDWGDLPDDAAIPAVPLLREAAARLRSLSESKREMERLRTALQYEDDNAVFRSGVSVGAFKRVLASLPDRTGEPVVSDLISRKAVQAMLSQSGPHSPRRYVFDTNPDRRIWACNKLDEALTALSTSTDAERLRERVAELEIDRDKWEAKFWKRDEQAQDAEAEQARLRERETHRIKVIQENERLLHSNIELRRRAEAAEAQLSEIRWQADIDRDEANQRWSEVWR